MTNTIIINDSEDQSKNRMLELLAAFEKKNEVIREKTPIKLSEEKIEEEKKRLKEIAKLDENGMTNYAPSNMTISNPAGGGMLGAGQSVNTFMNNQLIGNGSNVTNNKNIKQGSTVNTFMSNLNPNANKPYNPNYTYLQSTEALRLAISRALDSGAPINNVGFYEEVNWVLNGLGFNSRSALEIKQALKKMIKD